MNQDFVKYDRFDGYNFTRQGFFHLLSHYESRLCKLDMFDGYKSYEVGR